MDKGGRRRSRRMRGGNGYGVGQPISVGSLEYVPNMTSNPNGAAYAPTGGRRRRSRRGGVLPPPPIKNPSTTKSTAAAANTLVNVLPYSTRGGSRRRSRRGRKTRRHRMRGGGSIAGVGYSFTGDGARGMANHSAYVPNPPPGGAFAIPSSNGS
jgi:hypothetical protein